MSWWYGRSNYDARIDDIIAARVELKQDMDDHEQGLLINLAEIADAKTKLREAFNG